MNLFLRLMMVILRARRSKTTLPIAGKSRIRFRVWVTDLDAFMHMTNSRYLSMTDLGMTDFLIRTGLRKKMDAENLQLNIVHKGIDIHRSLGVAEAFHLDTHIVGCTGIYIVAMHEFHSASGTFAASCLSISKVVSRDNHPTLASFLSHEINEFPPLSGDIQDIIARLNV